MAGPLSGTRVVDLTRMVSGPFATLTLADQGADVIKVEPLPDGDPSRYAATFRGGFSAGFVVMNRNKRSLALNLKDARAIELVERLVAGADVFIQNFRPGAAEGMGLGEPRLRQLREDLVYVSIAGFGDKGPYAHRPVYDALLQALSGVMDLQGRDSGRPRSVRTILPDKLMSITAAQAITAALFARERGAGGQHVRLSMLDTMIAWMWLDGMPKETWIGEGVTGGTPKSQDFALETADGFIALQIIQDKEWAAFCRAAERAELADDPRFNTLPQRILHGEAYDELVIEIMKTRSSADWLARFDKEGVPAAPILSPAEVRHNPQVIANELIVESEHPQGGPLRQPRPVPHFEGTPSELRLPTPGLGEQSEEILREVGVSRTEFEALVKAGVVGS